MGRRATIQVLGARSLVDRGIDRLHELEATWSRLLPMSELNRLNSHAGRWVPISDDLYHALANALRLHRLTDGLYDPAILPAMTSWGYDRTYGALDALTPDAPPQGELIGLELNGDGRALVRHGTRLDLSAIGAGLAADTVALELLDAGADGVYFELGSTARAAGVTPECGWPVALIHPITGRPFACHSLSTGGSAVVDGPVRGWGERGLQARQLIDPRTGTTPVTDVTRVVVTSWSAARAEALAQAAVIAGAEAGARLLASMQSKSWVVTAEHVIVVD